MDKYVKIGELKALNILIGTLWEHGIISGNAFRELTTIILEEDAKIREEIEANKV